MMHISGRGSILTFHSGSDHQRETLQTLHSEGNILHKLYCTGLAFPTFHFGIVLFTGLSSLLTIPQRKGPVFLRKLLLFRYSTPNLTIAFHFWQYLKCLNIIYAHACPSALALNCFKMYLHRSAADLHNDPHRSSILMWPMLSSFSQNSGFLPSKTKLSSGCFCSVSLHRGQVPPGNGSDLSG